MKRTTLIIIAFIAVFACKGQDTEKLVDSYVVTELYVTDKNEGGLKKINDEFVANLMVLRIQFKKDSSNIFSIEDTSNDKTLAFAKVSKVNCLGFKYKADKDALTRDSSCYKGFVLSGFFGDFEGDGFLLDNLKPTNSQSEKEFNRFTFIFDDNRSITAIGYRYQSNYDQKFKKI